MNISTSRLFPVLNSQERKSEIAEQKKFQRIKRKEIAAKRRQKQESNLSTAGDELLTDRRLIPGNSEKDVLEMKRQDQRDSGLLH